MGEIRTPRPYYFKGGVVEFFVKNKQVYFKTLIWNNEGSLQFEFETGLLKEDYIEIANRALQSFSSVSRSE